MGISAESMGAEMRKSVSEKQCFGLGSADTKHCFEFNKKCTLPEF